MAHEEKILSSTLLESLMQQAIRISKPIAVYFPELNVKEVIRPDCNPMHQHKFCVRNGVLCFVERENTFVVPSTEDRIKILVSNHFVSYRMTVIPFADGDIPTDPNLFTKWMSLIDEVI